MSITNGYFKFFLVDTPSMLAYYVDIDGNIQKGNVTLGKDLALPQSPGGWDEMQLTFGRSSHYWGLNRTFTIPLKFIGDGAKIIRTMFYTGRGVEAPLTLVILKWDPDTDVFRLYYSGQVDLSKIEDQVAEGVTVNIMQGGVVQMFKAYENTPFGIQLDGSIPENIKVNCDGILFNDTFHYQILNMQVPYPGVVPLPCSFVSNDGDNIGIIRNDQMMEQPYAGYYQKSGNFLFSSERAITVRLQGTIIIQSDWRVSNTLFYMFTATSLSQPRGVGGTDHAVGLVTPQNDPSGIFFPADSQLNINGQRSFNFDATINLEANENLFVFLFNNFADNPITIIGGSFSLSFSSRYRSSRVWAIKPYDLGNQLIKRMNALSSNFVQNFSYLFDSMLLQQKQNLVVTSGDALRASTDPNYYQYFNQATLNPANPNNQDYTQFASLGAQLKTTISDYFDSYNAELNGAMSNQTLPGETESLFFEDKKYVMDPSVITMTLSKIANFRVSLALDYFFNWLKIGYDPQQYDEKAGKYEYNSLVQWQAPIRTLSKVLEIKSKYRADSYGVEYTRYNTSGGKSSTYNGNDNSVFFLNVDFSSFIFDYYEAYFISGIPNPSSLTNTDQKLILNQYYQPVFMDNLDGEYFTSQNDYSIFMFNQPAPGTRTIAISFTALINGLVGDSATITFWINGVPVQTWLQGITGVNTTFNGTYSGSRAFNRGDNIYFTVDTVRTCTVEITDFHLDIGSGYWTADTSGPINVAAGASRQLISLPALNPSHVSIGGQNIPVVSSGFQYFRFLSNVGNKNFDWLAGFSIYHQGNSLETFTFDIWKNGINIGTFTQHGNSNTLTWYNQPDPTTQRPPANFSGNITFALYDIIWLTGSCTNINTYITNAQFKATSTGVKAYNLLRPSITGKSDNSAYDNISGVPNPETAFNIEDLTPKRMLQRNSNLLSPMLFNLAPGQISFQVADKNQFLSTTKGGETITENAQVDIHDLDDPLFYPLLFEFDTEVPINFADLFNLAANGHIAFEYKNKTFYGFPIQVTAKPAMNESQTWKLLCSPKTNLSDLVDLGWDGIDPLMPLDITIPLVCPIRVVPLNFMKDSRYKSATMDEDWYVNRIQTWNDQQNYYMPRQNNEPIPWQCRTSGLDPVSVQIYTQQGLPVGSPINIPSIAGAPVRAGETLYQGTIDISTLPDGIYYFIWTIGTGEAQFQLISEGVYVKQDWDSSTIRIDYSHSQNRLGVVFSTDPVFNIRVHGQIGRYTPKNKFTTFVDQPQDIDLLNAIPYDTWKLEIGRSSGIPDYMMQLMERIFSLDTVFIDGNQYSRDAEAQWEKQNFPGQAKEYLTLDIRRAHNSDALTYNKAGQLTTDMLGGYTLDPTAFGQSTNGQNLIQVSNS